LNIFYRLLNKDVKFIWSEKEKENFKEIKRLWAENLELTIPDPNKTFVLETDASLTGLGACLSQGGKSVAYISRTLTPEEKNYGITEREVLAALLAMKKLQYFLVGKQIKLVTDHKATEFIKKKIDFGTPIIRRWFHRLERFNFEVEYKKGSELVIADSLRRSCEV
jgi:hypothetical protein